MRTIRTEFWSDPFGSSKYIYSLTSIFCIRWYLAAASDSATISFSILPVFLLFNLMERTVETEGGVVVI